MRYLRLCLVVGAFLTSLHALDQPVQFGPPPLERGFYTRQELASSSPDLLSKLRAQQDFVPGSYIVELQEKLALQGNQALTMTTQAKMIARRDLRRRIVDLENRGRASRGRPRLTEREVIVREFSYLFNGWAVRLDEATAEEIKSLPGIKAVTPDWIVRATSGGRKPSGSMMAPAQAGKMPALPATEVRLPGVPVDPGFTGHGVVIAVIDSGVDYTHPDLGGCLGPGCKVIGGYDFVNDDTDPMDDAGHGTHVAGIAAAKGTMLGVAPDARLLALKVLDSSGVGKISSSIAALEWAVANGADVVNLSLGHTAILEDDPGDKAVEKAVAAGVVVVAAAGNSGPNYYTVGSPGVAPSAITVGASHEGAVVSFSSRGPTKYGFRIKPEVVAPGFEIRSTVPKGQCSGCDQSGYRVASGTSMASPYVAGAAALLLERFPDWTPLQVKTSLTSHARDLALGPYVQGAGDVDIQAILGSGVTLSQAPLSLGLLEPLAPDLGQTVTVQFTNSSTVPATYDLSFDHPLPTGFDAAVSSNQLVVPPGQTVTVDLAIAVQNTVLPPSATFPCDYSGVLVAKSATETLRLPFALVKGAVLNVVFRNSSQQASAPVLPPQTLVVHDRKGWMQQVPILLSTTQEVKLILPPAQYDLFAHYARFTAPVPSAGILLEEGVNLEARVDEDLDAKEIALTVKFQPSYPEGAPLGSSTRILGILRHKSSGVAIPFDTDGLLLYAAPISDAYAIELVMVNDGIAFDKPLYTFHGFVPDGIREARTFSNDPKDFRHVRLDHSLRLGNRALDSVIVLDLDPYLTAISDNKIGKPRDLYLALPPRLDFKAGYLVQFVYDTDGWAIYRTARWRAASRTVLESRDWGEAQLPLALTASDLIPAAVGPYYWTGRFQNKTDQIRIFPSFSSFDGVLFRGQCGDTYRVAGLTYQLLGSSAPPTLSEPLPPVLPVTPGPYTMVITLPDPSRPGEEAMLTARFDTSRADPNPPYLTGFRFLKRGEFSEVFSAGQPRTLWFRAADDKQLGRVELWLDQGTGPQKMALTSLGNAEYQVILPALGTTVSAGLRLELEDTSGNLIRFGTTLPSASAELGITAAGRDKALIGRTARFDVNVSNSGFDSTDSKITVTETLPAGLGLVSAAGDHWSCAQEGPKIKCERTEPIYARTSSTLAFVVGIGREAYPSVSTLFQIQNQEDSNPSNNFVELATGVDGTAFWTSLGPFGGDVYSLAGDPLHPETVYAGVWGGIYKSTNRGLSWFPATQTIPDAAVTALAINPQNTSVVYAGTDGYGAWKSTDGGVNWKPLKSAALSNSTVFVIRLEPGRPETIYAGYQSGVLQSTDGGSSWTKLSLSNTNPGSVSDIAIHPSRPSTVYAATMMCVYLSTDGGTTWRTSLDLRPTAPTGLVGDSYDGGNHGKWARLAFDPDDPSTVWANTVLGVHNTTNGGSSWRRMRILGTGFYPTAMSVGQDTQRTIYLASEGGIWRSTDRGGTWTRLPLPESGFIDDFLIGADGTVFATNSVGVHSSANKGDTWFDCGDIAGVQARALVIDPNNPGSVLAGTSLGLIAGSGGGDWLPADKGFKPTLLVADPHYPGTFYAAGAALGTDLLLFGAEQSGIWKSTDGGRSWVACSNGINDLTMPGVRFSSLVVDPQHPGTLYIGVYREPLIGEVYKSTNGGVSWVAASKGLPTPSVVDCLAVDSSTGHLFAGVTGSSIVNRFGLYRSTDGAATWMMLGTGLPKSKIKTIAFSGNGPPRSLFLGTEGAGLYRSMDDGATFSQVGNGLPESANVSTLVVDPSGTLFVGTYGGGLFVSYSGGESWSVLDDGLTNLWINTLVVDPHDPRKLYVATSTGVFGICLAPDFALSVQHNAKLLAGGVGAWSVNVTNKGSAPSRDNIPVNLTVPAALRLLKSTGSGWNCVPNGDTVRCSTTKPVAPDATAPGLGLVFEVDEKAADSGGTTIRVESLEDVVPSNDAFVDQFNIVPAAISRLPLFKSETDTFLGIALSNSSAKRTDVVVTALDRSGALIDLPQNPAELALDPGTQLARLSSELLGAAPAQAQEGWIRIAAEEPIATMFQYGSSRKLDGGTGAVGQPKLLYLTRACQGKGACAGFTGRTLVNLVNPNSGPVTVRAVLSARPGSWGDRKVTKVIPGKGSLISNVSDLFAVSSVERSFIKLEVLEGEGIVASELIDLDEAETLVWLPAHPAGAGNRLYSAQLADVPGLFTSLKLVNTAGQIRNIRVTTIGDNGEALTIPKELQLDAAKSLEENCGTWFDWLPGKERIGSLVVESDGPGVIGSVLFGSSTGDAAAASPLQSEPLQQVTFSQVANGTNVYTGLALFNPGTAAADVTIRVFTAEGSKSGETIVPLQPGTRVSKLLTDLIPETAGQIGGYVSVTVTGGIIAQEFFGGAGFLSAVPASR